MDMLLESPVIATVRLRLAPLVAGDAQDLFAIRGDDEAMRHWDWPGDANAAQTAVAVEAHLTEMACGDALYWTARFADTGALAGLFDLSNLRSDAPDIGFMVARAHWRQGIASEACAALIAHARALGHHALAARIHEGNHASARLLGQFGFTESALPRAVEVRPGVAVVCRFFALELKRREAAAPD